MNDDSKPIDSDQVEGLVHSLMDQHPAAFMKAVRTYAAKQAAPSETPAERRERMRRLIQLDFDQYEKVFKMLA